MKVMQSHFSTKISTLNQHIRTLRDERLTISLRTVLNGSSRMLITAPRHSRALRLKEAPGNHSLYFKNSKNI